MRSGGQWLLAHQLRPSLRPPAQHSGTQVKGALFCLLRCMFVKAAHILPVPGRLCPARGKVRRKPPTNPQEMGATAILHLHLHLHDLSIGQVISDLVSPPLLATVRKKLHPLGWRC